MRPHLRPRVPEGIGLAPPDATAGSGHAETNVADQQRDDRRRRRASSAAARAATGDRGRDRHARPAAENARPDGAGASLSNPLMIRLVAVVALGLVLGAILGALSVAGWLIGLLVAAATVSLTARSIARGAPERHATDGR